MNCGSLKNLFQVCVMASALSVSYGASADIIAPDLSITALNSFDENFSSGNTSGEISTSVGEEQLSQWFYDETIYDQEVNKDCATGSISEEEEDFEQDSLSQSSPAQPLHYHNGVSVSGCGKSQASSSSFKIGFESFLTISNDSTVSSHDLWFRVLFNNDFSFNGDAGFTSTLTINEIVLDDALDPVSQSEVFYEKVHYDSAEDDSLQEPKVGSEAFSVNQLLNFSLAAGESKQLAISWSAIGTSKAATQPGNTGTLNYGLSVTAVPEPSALAIMLLGLFGLVAKQRVKK